MKRKNVILMAAMLLFTTNTTRIWVNPLNHQTD